MSEFKTQIGAWVENPGPNARIEIRDDLPIPPPGPNQVLIKLECSGVCHSDVHNMLGQTPMTTTIGGHVVKLGSNAPLELLGKRVGVKWINEYCNDCEICTADVTTCPNQHNSGRDVPGTFQQFTILTSRGVEFYS